MIFKCSTDGDQCANCSGHWITARSQLRGIKVQSVINLSQPRRSNETITIVVAAVADVAKLVRVTTLANRRHESKQDAEMMKRA